MAPSDFTTVANLALRAMADRAQAMGVQGAAVVAWATLSPARQWTSHLHIVGSMTSGTNNLIAIAYSKAAEMADTLIDSGSEIRPPLRGEFGCKGGVIRPLAGGHILAVFSGATGEQDVDISLAAFQLFSQHYG